MYRLQLRELKYQNCRNPYSENIEFLKGGAKQGETVYLIKPMIMDYNNPNVPPPGYGQPLNTEADDIRRGKAVAILSYCTLLGWIIAIILHQNDKTRFGAYHLRQGLGLIIFWMGSLFAIVLVGMVLWLLWWLFPWVQLAGIAFAIVGIVNAGNDRKKGLPLIGELSEKMLAGIN